MRLEKKLENYITKPERFLDKETIQKVQLCGFLHSDCGSGEEPITYVIGDIHGMNEYLIKLLDYLTSVGHFPAKFVFTGDYVDRGPDSLAVIAIVRLLEEIMGDKMVIALKGNHEAMLLSELKRKGRIYQDPKSYGYTRTPGIIDRPDDDIVIWLKNLRYMYEDDLHYYVHAGFEPNIPINMQTSDTMLWIRDGFIKSDINFGKHVFHGHTPNFNFEQTKYRTNVDTGAVFGGAMIAAEVHKDKKLPLAIHYVLDNISGKTIKL